MLCAASQANLRAGGYASALAAGQDSERHDEIYFLDGKDNLWHYGQDAFVDSNDFAQSPMPYAWSRLV